MVAKGKNESTKRPKALVGNLGVLQFHRGIDGRGDDISLDAKQDLF